MVIIYDFDGTLTPYSLAQYEILKKCGYTDAKLMERVEKEIKSGNAENFYDSWYKCYKEILHENELKMSKDNVCLGAENIIYNDGVVDFFDRLQSK